MTTTLIRALLWNPENMDSYWGGAHVRTQADANALAAAVDVVAINRNAWFNGPNGNLIPGMRATNPVIKIYAYMNIGEAQGTEVPGTYLPASAYAKNVLGVVITNPGQGDNFLMNLQSPLWLADRIAKANSDYLATTDGDGIYLDVVGPGPQKWYGPTATGSYTGKPVHLDSSGNVRSVTLNGAISNTATALVLSSWPSWLPASGNFKLAIKHASDASIEIVTVTGGHGTVNLTTAARTQDNVAHADGATIAWAYSDAEWIADSITSMGSVKTALAIPTYGNGAGSGPLYVGAFPSDPSPFPTGTLYDQLNGGSIENFVRDAGDAVATFKPIARWLDALTMMDAAAAKSAGAGHDLWLITKTWVTGTDAEKLRCLLYSACTFLLGYTAGFRYSFVKDHSSSFNQATYVNPLSNVPIGTPAAARVDVAGAGAGAFTRRYTNGFVVVNPQSTAKNVTLPATLIPYTGGAAVASGTVVSVPANTGLIYLDDLTPGGLPVAHFPVQRETVVGGGYAPQFDQPDPGGVLVDNDEHMQFVVRNAGGSSVTAVFNDVLSALAFATAYNPDVTVTIPAGGERFYGPFPRSRFSDRLAVTFSDTTDILCAAVGW